MPLEKQRLFFLNRFLSLGPKMELHIKMLIRLHQTQLRTKCEVRRVDAFLLFNPQAPGEGEISLPHSRAIFSKLKNEDKDLFCFRNCKK